MESAFHEDIDSAMFPKMYRSNPEGQTRYSPAACIGCETKIVTIQGAERCFTDLGCGCADYLGRSAPEVNFQSTVNEATAPIGV